MNNADKHVSTTFLKELSKYYKAFLESDFKKEKMPARRVFERDLALEPYAKLQRNIDTLLEHNFKQSAPLLLSKEEDGELFERIFHMWRDKQASIGSGGLDVYLNIYTITHHVLEEDREMLLQFPLFYIGIDLEYEEDTFSMDIEPVLYLNEKAIGFLVEKYGERHDSLFHPELPFRKIYLDQFEEKGALRQHLDTITGNLETFFEDDASFAFGNDFFFSLFDKSDESIINDYEEFLDALEQEQDNEAFSNFHQLTYDFLFENPKTFDIVMDQEYEEKPIGERFVYYSPIPLNKEQQKIIEATKREDIKRIVIEGPPGTGKSHTITAIIYSALLDKKSVLMVSDKKEALDVVEDKINQTLDKMKVDFVQNPILRIGKHQSNPHKILTKTNLEKIKDRRNAFRSEEKRNKEAINRLMTTIQHDIKGEIEASASLSVTDIRDSVQYEETYHRLWSGRLDEKETSQPTFVEALFASKDSTKKLLHFWQELQNIGFLFSADTAVDEVIKEANSLVTSLMRIDKRRQSLGKDLLLSEDLTESTLGDAADLLHTLDDIKHPFFGYLFCGKKVQQVERQFLASFLSLPKVSLKKEKERIGAEIQFYQWAKRALAACSFFEIDPYAFFQRHTASNAIQVVQGFMTSLTEASQSLAHYPGTKQKLGLVDTSLRSYGENPLLGIEDQELIQLREHLARRQKIDGLYTTLSKHDYSQQREELDNRLVAEMTNILDERVIQFEVHYRNDAVQLRKKMKRKEKLSKGDMEKLIEAFPCVIASLRDLGDFMSLEPNMFDLVIIDEASQVSVAQAFPAILRAKKVIVLGDPKQFSNIKSANASKDMNNRMFANVRASFSDPAFQDRIENFNIGNSILDFMTSIANYHTMLKKHFRGYSELISYSNITFGYGLEVMKIRSKPIQEVIQFHVLTPDAKKDIRKNTNEKEATFILGELERLRQEGFTGTVGIITPLREQQKWITQQLYASPFWQHFYDVFRVKVATFDTCQGEEWDIVYYSMVEKSDERLLTSIFPVNLESNLDKVRGQRLNVGFSRIKESARFVLSKAPEAFTSEARGALLHFQHLLQTSGKEPSPSAFDSVMEEQLYHWVKETDFYQAHRERMEIDAQFEMGKYLKQIDKTATFPDYRVDFLLKYHDGKRTKTVILEYDGFEYHFQTDQDVNQYNYQHLYTDADIERQRTIESYGYPFIRINKFIVREDPVRYLDQELQKIFGISHFSPAPTLQKAVQEAYVKAQNKEIKECGKCKKTKPIEDFYDPKLKNKYGRHCLSCKQERSVAIKQK